MLKILLVYDDFQELTSAELLLKKMGFDVVGITSEFSLAEQLLSFNPQIVVAQGRTAKVSTSSVGRRLRESTRWEGHCVLIFYSNSKPQATELLKIRMDVALEHPAAPTKLVQVVAELGGLDANQLLDKLIKSMTAEETSGSKDEVSTFSHRSENESVLVSGGKSVPQDTNQRFGGAAGAEERKKLAAGEVIQDTNQKLIAKSEIPVDQIQKVESGSVLSSSNPLFPLSLQSQEQGPEKKALVGSSEDSQGGQVAVGNFDVGSFKMNNLPHDPVMQELESLLKKKSDLSVQPLIEDPARRTKYDAYMKTIPIKQLASIRRRDAKVRLKDLIKDKDQLGLQDQDVLRREFVKALFKKEE